LESWLTKL
jgi:hypothetical protein